MTSNSSSQNVSSCSTGGSNAVAGGSGWLGFSLSPQHMASMDAAAADGGASNGVQHQHLHGGLYYPLVNSSPAPYCYALGSGQDSVLAQAAGGANGGGGFYPALSSMPLRSDGSLCITEALRRSAEEQHYGKLY
jgi:AP2-like factor, ANT lineage